MNSEISSALLRVLPFVVALLFIAIAIRRGKIRREKIALHKASSVSIVLVWVTLFTVYAVAVDLVLAQVQLLEVDKWNHPLMPSIIRILGAVLFAPVLEEIVFRGVFLSMLADRMNIHPAIVIQALVFVLLHSFTYENTLASHIGVVQAMADGMLYGYARRNTGSLYTPMAMHMIGNCIATVERFIV